MSLADMKVSPKVLTEMLSYKADIEKAVKRHIQECETLEQAISEVFILGMAFQQVRMGGNKEILE